MLDRRVTRPFVVVAAAVLLSPCLPAVGDPSNPTRAELEAARDRVAAARSRVADLQVRAEHAAESYNGALSRSRAAAVARDRAREAAATALEQYAVAQSEATAALSVGVAATQAAQAAVATKDQTEREALAAQRALDQMASGAFRSGGHLAMLSQLFVARDPLELANGKNLINLVGAHQQRVISSLHTAKRAATAAAAQATVAGERAVKAADIATAALAVAVEAREAAATTSRAATDAATKAGRAVVIASKAKAYAQVLVTSAEAALGSAKQRAANLERAAAEARRAARGVRIGTAPSDAAATAIQWAFEQIGIPYSWGGGDEDGPTRGFAQGADTVGFDCSGLTLFIYAKAGIRLDHYTGSQWNQGKRISSRADLLPGDLMFFAYDTSSDATIHHVSIYLGNGRMIEAPYTGEVVRVTSAGRDDFIGATRPWA
jgi:cell wall-associated NlpC family hydrolase